MSRSPRVISLVVAAVCAATLVAVPAEARTKSTVCTRTLKLDTKAFSTRLALGATTGFTENAVARAKLNRSLKSAAARFNTKVKIRNGACTREVKRQAIARDATIRRAKTTLTRAVARQKYAAAVTHAQAVREDAIYRAFLGWMDEVDSIYAQYDAATNSPTTATARATFRSETKAVRDALRGKVLTAYTRYLSARSAANAQRNSLLNAAAGEASASAKSVAILSAWDSYVKSVSQAQQRALKDRSDSLPEATDELEAAHAEYEDETEGGPSGPEPYTPDPADSASPVPTP